MQEDGATLDFRGSDFSTSTNAPSVFYGAGTTVLGTLPAARPPGVSRGTIVRQLKPISISRDVGTFAQAVPIDVTIVGDRCYCSFRESDVEVCDVGQ